MILHVHVESQEDKQASMYVIAFLTGIFFV